MQSAQMARRSARATSKEKTGKKQRKWYAPHLPWLLPLATASGTQRRCCVQAAGAPGVRSCRHRGKNTVCFSYLRAYTLFLCRVGYREAVGMQRFPLEDTYAISQALAAATEAPCWQYVSKLEHGKVQDITVSTLCKLCQVLSCSADALLGLTEKRGKHASSRCRRHYPDQL
jgi:hypothetical protein